MKIINPLLDCQQNPFFFISKNLTATPLQQKEKITMQE